MIQNSSTVQLFRWTSFRLLLGAGLYLLTLALYHWWIGSGFAWWKIFIAGISTLAIFSFLYRENPFYRFFEHLYIGIATGIGIMATLQTFLWPQVLKPMFGLDQVVFPDGTSSETSHPYAWIYLIPMVLGCFYYFIYSRRWNWLAQLVIGLSLGASGGLAFKGFFNEAIPQIQSSFKPLYLPGSWSETWSETASNFVFVFTLLMVLSYFFFTFRRKEGGLVGTSARLGRFLMMGCFGAFFGSTIMARMALLVERLGFLLNTWIPALTQ